MPKGVYKHYPHQLLQCGENNPNWKTLLGDDSFKTGKEKRNLLRKIRRHELGISKKYSVEYTGISKTKQYKKWQRQKYKSLRKNGGKLTIQTIQLVYEDNIKRYGTLTCYLCLQPIPFGKDHLEHKIPLSRSGTNEYNNLEIACQHCNLSKHDKTEEEYRKGSQFYGEEEEGSAT